MLKVPYRFLFIALVLLALTACGDGEEAPTPTPAAVPTPTSTPAPTPTPTPIPTPTSTPTPVSAVDSGGLSPQEILERTLVAMQEVGSLHFELDATVTVPAGGVETEVPVSLVADYQPPDRMRAKLVVSVAFFALEMETIAIGDTIYATNLETGEWEVSSIDLTSALLRPTEFEGDVVIAENYDVVLVGLETLDGTPVFHLRGLPPQQIFGELDATAQANLWVGVEDLLIRQIAAEGEIALEELGEVFGQFGLSGTANISSTVRISGFGEPVLIEAPQIP